LKHEIKIVSFFWITIIFKNVPQNAMDRNLLDIKGNI